jgi:hypothetical protein
LLPGNTAVIFTSWTGPAPDEKHIAVQRLATGERRVRVPGGDTARYAMSGHIVYPRADELFALALDLQPEGDRRVPCGRDCAG